VYLTHFAPASAVERITKPDTSGSGRADIWKIGWRMVRANPVLGVGAGNYTNSAVHYLLEPGDIKRSDYIVDQPKVAHNVYLQVLAELGVVGLALFVGVIGFSLLSVARAARAFARAGDRSMELLARGLLIAMVGLLAAFFFASAIYSKQLWLLLGVCGTLPALAPKGVAADKYRR
jgi:O-antigen ligase